MTPSAIGASAASTPGSGTEERTPLLDAIVVDVEVDVSSGLPQTTTVGLPDGAVREAADRIWAALHNSGFAYPQRRVTVNLAPAGVRKEGPHYDLPIALGILAAHAKPPLPDLASWCVLGELGLDGRIHAVRGALPMAAADGRFVEAAVPGCGPSRRAVDRRGPALEGRRVLASDAS
jgi:hypothetical protein